MEFDTIGHAIAIGIRVLRACAYDELGKIREAVLVAVDGFGFQREEVKAGQRVRCLGALIRIDGAEALRARIVEINGEQFTVRGNEDLILTEGLRCHGRRRAACTVDGRDVEHWIGRGVAGFLFKTIELRGHAALASDEFQPEKFVRIPASQVFGLGEQRLRLLEHGVGNRQAAGGERLQQRERLIVQRGDLISRRPGLRKQRHGVCESN
jgi:hypothetical protein